MSGEVRDETKDAWVASWRGLVDTGRSLNFIPKAVGTFRRVVIESCFPFPTVASVLSLTHLLGLHSLWPCPVFAVRGLMPPGPPSLPFPNNSRSQFVCATGIFQAPVCS